ncbi:oxidoreductase [Paenibacillus baekrokdamisoli]|uniref:Oxidoreductase n=1 Tax=Paenibacillus baekrokdamisoli TaxID=1712516 RepID=A0A3G9J1F0_9BACL|nr:Gfo/Idh/MocA family oxidoreductase [Paenibacillus baekrokdamisoli]MBB3069416.1 putative dehydrogenase [Paenibacillus baekrokdamisoli]BBH25010.1 oxidoreductase [Paenibacillus baekrokdamisoli]
MRSVTFAIVGCGTIACKHVISMAACQEARLVAVCDLNAERMEQIAALWHEESGEEQKIAKVAEFRELLADPSIQVIVISTLSSLHAEFAKEALQANKHVVLEKPIALSLQDADDLIRIASERNLYVQVCHQLRYRPLMRKIKDLVLGGELGEIRMGVANLRLNRSISYYQSANWRGTWEHDGGMLLNQGIHIIDLLLWYLGKPQKVYGELSSVHSFKETEDMAAGIISFSNHAKGIIEANSITLPANLEQSLFLLGEKGTICLGGGSLGRIDRWYIEGCPNAAEEARLLMKDTNEHLYMYQAMVDAILGKQHAELIDASEGKRALELIFAIYLSASTANVQHFPLSEFSTSMMKMR